MAVRTRRPAGRLRTVVVAISMALSLLLARPAAAQAQDDGPKSVSLDPIFERLYNVDFAGARALLDEFEAVNPTNPLAHSVRAVTDTFAEMQRLRILETEFFVDDRSVTSDRPMEADPAARDRIMAEVEEARRLAELRLETAPDDRDALFALCMSANVVTDYTALIARQQFRGLLLAREILTYAERLVALDPPVYDAYHAMGVLEYINSRVPFFIRWFVRFRNVEGSEARAAEHLERVVRQGRYYGPFAKVLLAVLHLRADRPEQARVLLAELTDEFPENPLFPKELERVNELIAAAP